MISEPTAAAVAYGLYEKEKDTRFLVFDLGGGTFDVSILELYHNILEVRAVAGDNYLGGEDFTEVMSKLFLQKTGLHYKDLSEKEQVRLYKKAEEAKRGISDQTAVTMELMLGEENKTAEITFLYQNLFCLIGIGYHHAVDAVLRAVVGNGTPDIDACFIQRIGHSLQGSFFIFSVNG